MKRTQLALVIGALCSTQLVGCGGGSSSSSTNTTPYAYYVDAAVAGINYTCGSETGTTDSNGKFFFEEGADCTFSIGSIALKTISSTVLEDVASGETIQETDTAIAQILQNLDDDGDPTNGIDVSVDSDSDSDSDTQTKAEAFVAAMTEAEITDISTVDLSDDTDTTATAVSSTVTTVVEDAGDVVISEAEATTHLINTILSDSKGLLDVGYDGDLSYGKVLFSVDSDGNVTSATYTDQVGSDNGEASITLSTSQDDSITLTIADTESSESNTYTLELVKVDDNSHYIEMTNQADSSNVERLYPLADKAAAETYLIRQRLAGNTTYAVVSDTDAFMESWTFSSDLSTGEWVNENDGESGTTTITFKDLEMVVTDDDDASVNTLTFTDIQANYFAFSYEYTEDGSTVSGSGRIYHDETEASEYLASLESDDSSDTGDTGTSDTIAMTNDMVSGQTWYADDFYKITFGSNYTLTSLNMLNPEQDDGSESIPYVINASGQLVAGVGSELTTITLLGEGSDSYSVEITETEDGGETYETYEQTLYTNQSALEASLYSDLSSEREVLDETDDSTNGAHAGFELLSVSAVETSDAKLQVTVTANGDIQEALNSEAPAGYSHILWIGINENMEFGMNANGSWVNTDYWSNGDYIPGTHVSTDYYSVSINGASVTFTLDADQVPTNDYGYLYVDATVGQDYNGDGDEENDDSTYDEVALGATWSYTEYENLLTGAWVYSEPGAPMAAVAVIVDNENYVGAQQTLGAGGVIGGVESGTYNLNTSDTESVFTSASPVINSNADDTLVGATLTVTSGASTAMTLSSEDGSGALTKIVSTTDHPEAGAWYVENPDEITLIVLDGNGNYMHVDLNESYTGFYDEDYVSDSTPSEPSIDQLLTAVNYGHAIVNATEFGTYTLNESAITFTPAATTDFTAVCEDDGDAGCDTVAGNSNGDAGPSGFAASVTLPYSFSDSGLTLDMSDYGESTETFSRID
ncbi:hypothetical protein DI392_14410 [Vibrio albus]|uniref:Cadherin-like beta sandwich domain-containing protein n=1 Tax=Vibrio albus TaxID=2200953 RepID=A0A2U3B736_9VIBR|nr:hypothetical protein [Vibrio albus]PWI32609.1 hypothetical protein DI392_14410 [Vibrio albus]